MYEVGREDLLIIAELLELASDKFGNHSCNDLSDDLIKLLPGKKWKEILLESYPNEEEYKDIHEDVAGEYLSDDGLMFFYAERIKRLIKE